MLRGAVNHVDLTVSDPAVSVPFYDRVLRYLDFAPIAVPSGDSALACWHSTVRGQRLFSIALQPASKEGRGRRVDRYLPGLHHLAFHAASREDVDGLHRLLHEIGATVLDPPREYPEYAPGYYAVFFADPDGVKLELVHMPSPPLGV